MNMSNKIDAVTINIMDIKIIGRGDEPFKVVKKSDLTNFRSWLESQETTSFIPDNSAVYFDKSIAFPRSKFKDSYPTCRITRDITNADVVAFDMSVVLKKLNSLYYTDYYREEGTNSNTYSTNTMLFPQGTKLEKVPFSELWSRIYNLQAVVDTVNVLSRAVGKKFIDIKDLSLRSDISLDHAAYSKLSRMFESSDEALHNTALRMLTGYDYATSKEKIAILLSVHYGKIYRLVSSSSVEVKSMIRKLEVEFPDCTRRNGIINNPFLIKSVMLSLDDPFMQSIFNDWLKHISPDLPEVQILRKDNEKYN